MRGLSSAETLAAWERACREPPSRRSLVALSVVTGESIENIVRWPLGKRDTCLLDLREQTFGSQLSALVDCPACAGTAQLTFDSAAMRVPTSARAHANGTVEGISLQHDGRQLRFRLPNTSDLEAIANCDQPAVARDVLFARCLLDEPAAEDVSATMISAVAAQMAAADPQADLQIAVKCPECGYMWDAPFDIATFFWLELQAGVRRLLQEVHELAAAYGWREAEILALSPARRAAYLDLVRT